MPKYLHSFLIYSVSIVNNYRKRLFITKNESESIYDVLGKSLNLNHTARKFIIMH